MKYESELNGLYEYEYTTVFNQQLSKTYTVVKIIARRDGHSINIFKIVKSR